MLEKSSKPMTPVIFKDNILQGNMQVERLNVTKHQTGIDQVMNS